MSESTLSITRAKLLREIGRLLPWSEDAEAWSSEQTTIADDIIESGLRQFYYPHGHDWSFRKPVGKLPLVSGVADYDLWDDFGGGFLDGHLTFARNDNATCHVTLVGVGDILKKRQADLVATSTHPSLAAVNMLPTDGARGQRWSLMVWPTPSAVGTLYGRYALNPEGIAASTPYPIGGPQHSETLKESVLAAAELMMNNESSVHRERFEKLLASSIAYDNRVNGQKHFGYNGDRSMQPVRAGRRTGEYVSYNGNFYLGQD